MQISTKVIVEIEAKELKHFLDEVEKMLYDTEAADVDSIKEFCDAAQTMIDQHEKRRTA